jgi:DNA polymerase V
MFALVDCNNFYASCERVFNPNLQGKPVAILSNNDGCVISMSDEAKKIGLPFGAPIFKWEQFCKEKNITVLSSNYPLYGDMSARVMSILAGFSPDVEVYSIDESFLELKGFENYDLSEYATKIRSRILKWTGIPTCVGIAPTKGLKAKGCVTAYDFTQISSDWVLKELSIVGWRLQKDLQGISKIPLEEVSSKKMIATTRSFEYTYSDIDNIKERISTFAASCAEKLRVQKSSCHMLIVQLSSDRHKKDLEQHRESKTVIFSHPTDSTLTIAKAAVEAVKTIFKSEIKYKRAGVIVAGLVPNDNYQLNLFDHENPKHKPLMSAIDSLNKKYKADKIKLASQDLQRTWKMRQERLSPKYTTNINEVLEVK